MKNKKLIFEELDELDTTKNHNNSAFKFKDTIPELYSTVITRVKKEHRSLEKKYLNICLVDSDNIEYGNFWIDKITYDNFE